MNAAVPQLMPLLLNCLTKQDEDFDEDQWTVAMAAGTAVDLVAQTVTDNIVPHVIPFVQENIQKPDWRLKDAAILTFGRKYFTAGGGDRS